MKDSDLYIADPHDPRLTAKEEMFMNNLAEKIPLIGKLIKGSERAYVGYLNKMRVDIFNRFADEYEAQGRTIENSPELYKGLASYVNNSTGRGNLGALESAAPIINSGLFAPRLIAARLNMLNPYYYYKLPKAVRIQALKDMGKFIGLGLTVLALAKAGGADVETDPRSSDFGKIKDGNTRWDIWGGFQQYIRVLAQLGFGQAKSTNTGQVTDLGSQGSFGRTRGDVLGSFVRGKLAPIPSVGIDFLTGRTAAGQKTTVGNELLTHLSPLLAGDIYDAFQDRGVKGAFQAGIPSTFGVGVQTYLPQGYSKAQLQDPTYKYLYDNHLNLTQPPQKDMTDAQYKDFLNVREGIFKDEWDNIRQYGAYINAKGNITTNSDEGVKLKEPKDLTQQDLIGLMKDISNSATRTAQSQQKATVE